MVVDFGVLKSIVNRLVVDRLDHSLVLRRSERNESILGVLKDRFGRVVEVDYQPTCENMISDFAARISAELPEGVELTALRLYETATSYAEWLAEDNR
jgi:6-pyruvoyltetrahydropterin/6-carboxytetrahydropterin synthase